MQSDSIIKLRNLINNSKIISIIPHKNPDGDALGSCLSLFLYLQKLGKSVKVISPTPYPDFLKWLPSENTILNFEKYESESITHILSSDTIFTLDFNNLNRAEPLTEILQHTNGVFVMIDHHQQPDNYAEITLSNSKCSSTCELLYEIFEQIEATQFIDQSIATCLYTGIMTDTGAFKYSLTTARTHQIVASLIEKGANPSEISSNVFDSFSLDRLHLLGKSLEKLIYIEQYKTAYIALSSNDLKQFNFKKGDTDSIVNYGLKIKEAELAVIFIEQEDENIIKISFRSKKNIDVNQLARLYFEGGGHINASGGKSSLNLNDTIQRFLSILPEFLK